MNLLLRFIPNDIAQKDPVPRVQVDCPTTIDGFAQTKTDPPDVLSNGDLRFGGVLFHAAPDGFWI
jgi:hypothetical protein